MEDLLQVGVITQTHGIRGEVKVFPTTDDANRFRKLKETILDTGKEKITLEIEGVKFFKQYVILRYKGKSLYVTRANAVKLRKDEYFIADLIDINVYDEEDKPFGILKDVIETGANDVYDIKMNDGRSVLVPAIKECILSVDIENRKMVIHLLDGLLED